MEVDYSLLIGLVVIALAIYFGLRGSKTSSDGKLGKSLEEKLGKIEKHAEAIKRIEDIALRLDERLYALSVFPKSAVEGVLKNVGKVKVTAEPGEKGTKYYVEVEKPVLKESFIAKRSVETWVAEKEKTLFGTEAPAVTVIDPRRAVFDLPSTDPKICSEYMTLFFRWLDSEYWISLRGLEGYEHISFES